jgi:hypothetical protein
MRDTAFKRSLKKVPLATEVKIGSTAGSFTLHKNLAKPAVFIAGRIGITPFFSIVRQANRDRLLHKLCLFYSNRRPVWALIISRNHLWHFLQRECFVDNILEVFGELEVQQMLNQFFDRVVYYSILRYEEAVGHDDAGIVNRKEGSSLRAHRDRHDFA